MKVSWPGRSLACLSLCSSRAAWAGSSRPLGGSPPGGGEHPRASSQEHDHERTPLSSAHSTHDLSECPSVATLRPNYRGGGASLISHRQRLPPSDGPGRFDGHRFPIRARLASSKAEPPCVLGFRRCAGGHDPDGVVRRGRTSGSRLHSHHPTSSGIPH